MPSNGAAQLDVEQLPFFAYGTLRHGCFNYERHLKGRTVNEQRGFLDGATLYDAGGFPFAVLTPDQPNKIVVGDLMTVDPKKYHEVLPRLDELEGYDPQDPGSLYRRVVVTVRTDAGPVKAWFYEAGDSVEQDFGAEDIIACGDWVLFENQKRQRAQATQDSNDRAS